MHIATQLALFLENKPGTLARVCEALEKAKINIYAVSTSDTIDHSVVRMVVSDTRKALLLFEEHGTLVVENDVLMIDTTYEKVDGPSVRVAVWTITQLASPERMFAPLPSDASTYTTLMPAQPKDLRVDDFHLSLARHTTEKTMIATNARSLAWIGAGRNLVITNVATYFDSGGGSAPLGRNAPHAGNTNAQIYTSPDGAEPYVELELLSPLVDLAPGQRVTMAVRYWLARREKADPDEEARRLFTDPRGAAPRS